MTYQRTAPVAYELYNGVPMNFSDISSLLSLRLDKQDARKNSWSYIPMKVSTLHRKLSNWENQTTFSNLQGRGMEVSIAPDGKTATLIVPRDTKLCADATAFAAVPNTIMSYVLSVPSKIAKYFGRQ